MGCFMSFVKSLAYGATGVGAVVLAPVTGSTSLAVAIGAGVGVTAMVIVKNKKARLRRNNERKAIQLEMTNLEDMLMFEHEYEVSK
jgi:hypothetical protein